MFLITRDRWGRGKKKDGSITALVKCPGCDRHASLSGHEIKDDGCVHPSLVCPRDGCEFHEFVKLEDWDKTVPESSEIERRKE
jgi:hypothetical protein